MVNDEWEKISSDLVETMEVTDLASTFTDCRFCPICGSINGWGTQISGTMLIRCKRCGVKYDATYVTHQQYIDGFEPPMGYRVLVEYYMNNIMDRRSIANKLVKWMGIGEYDETLIIGSCIGIYNTIIPNSIGIEASSRKIDIAHDIYDELNIYHMLAEEMNFINRFDNVIINNMLNDTDYPIKVINSAIMALRMDRIPSRLFIIHNPNQYGRLALSIDDVNKLVKLTTSVGDTDITYHLVDDYHLLAIKYHAG